MTMSQFIMRLTRFAPHDEVFSAIRFFSPVLLNRYQNISEFRAVIKRSIPLKLNVHNYHLQVYRNKYRISAEVTHV